MKKSFCFLVGIIFTTFSVKAEMNYWEQSVFFEGVPQNYCGRYKPSDASIKTFKSCFYIGAGYQFASHLDPEVITPGFTNTDDSDDGYNLYIGWSFEPRWFAELMYADLGEATLSSVSLGGVNSASVSYQIPSIHLGYWFLEPENRFNVYAKLGVSSISNDLKPTSFSIEDQDSENITGGLGVQWRSKSSGLFARLSADYYDENVYAFGLNVGYFLGRTEKYKKAYAEEKVIKVAKLITPKVDVEPIKLEPLKVEQVDMTPVDVTEVNVVPNTPVVSTAVERAVDDDNDNDGVRNQDDKCLTTKAGVIVDKKGCEIVDISLSGVRFRTNSADLTAYSQTILDKTAETLIDTPSVNVEIQAHTCNLGESAFNQTLSEQRANSVRDYLILKGVNPKRMQATGYGESRPIASNATKAGRHLNRRVELKVIK